ncbi:4'-phosphopantetheinyl transferase superfamily protein [Streptomyces halstedii]|uniref:4'-phosphopantetheinyl transferase superfamily protein n=1 Tax=Streptomyces halstedii TaxID=1944 RepID=UPI003826BA0B
MGDRGPAGPPATRTPAALARIWVRKEAYLKATGHGLASGATHPYVGTAPAPSPTPNWTLTDLPPPKTTRQPWPPHPLP